MWKIITFFGSFSFWTSLILIYFLASAWMKKSYLKNFKILLAFLIFSDLTILILKETFKIPRPCIGLEDCPIGYSFPSGHASRAWGFLILSNFIRNLKLKISFYSIPIFVALSRVFLNYHTIIDIIFGSMIGIFISFTILKFKTKIFELLP